MIAWLPIAIGGHVLNAAAFIIDKTLLSKTLKYSLTYAVLIGLLPIVVVVTIPWVDRWPEPSTWPAVAAYGSLFVFALWGFFEALKRAETSRVVPVIGSLIPILTLAGTSIFLGERIGNRAALGLGCLVIATWMLTRKKGGAALDRETLLICVASAGLFATVSVFGKYAYETEGFLGVLISSRLVSAATAIVLFMLVAPARHEALSVLRGREHHAGHGTTVLVIAGQTLGALGFLLVNIALSQGSATIVNALQAVQYAAIVLAAWFGGARLNRYLREDLSKPVIIQKIFAIALVGLGLALVAGPNLV